MTDPFDDEAFGGEPDDLDVADEVLGAHGASNASLDGKVSIRERRWQDLNSRAKFVRISPSSALHGSVGNQITLVLRADGTTPGGTVAQWTGDDAETLPLTVTLSPLMIDHVAGATLARFRPFGFVQWGTRGFMSTAEVDIGQGIQFTVGGSTMQIAVADEGVFFVGAASESQNTTRLGGMISFYPIERTQNPTRTRYFNDTVGVGASIVAIRPTFAQSLSVVRTATANTFNVEFRDSQDTVVGNSGTVAAGASLLNFPLSGDVAKALIQPTAGALGETRAIFNLAI